MVVWEQVGLAIGIRQDPFTEEDEESLRYAAKRELEKKAQSGQRTLWKMPVAVNVSMPVSTQYSMLTFLVCGYHIMMFFCIIAIENHQFGRQIEMKKAFLKMSQER